MDTEHIPGGEVWEPGAKPSPQKQVSPRARRGAIWNPVNRRNSREWAVQMLFLADANPPAEGGIDQTIAEFWEMHEIEEKSPPKDLRDFSEKLVRGAWANRDAIDSRILGYLTNWTLDRIGGVDRGVLRLAMYELFHCEETPPVVIVNEAVDIAKFFSTRDSGKFVNGVLNRAMQDVSRPPREANKPIWLRKKKP